MSGFMADSEKRRECVYVYYCVMHIIMNAKMNDCQLNSECVKRRRVEREKKDK